MILDCYICVLLLGGKYSVIKVKLCDYLNLLLVGLVNSVTMCFLVVVGDILFQEFTVRVFVHLVKVRCFVGTNVELVIFPHLFSILLKCLLDIVFDPLGFDALYEIDELALELLEAFDGGCGL